MKCVECPDYETCRRKYDLRRKRSKCVIAKSDYIPSNADYTSCWINVKNALPADNEKVLVCTRSKKMCVARWSARQERFVTSGNVTVTHWLPLPGLPREE